MLVLPADAGLLFLFRLLPKILWFKFCLIFSTAVGAIFSLLAQRKDPKERAPRSLGLTVSLAPSYLLWSCSLAPARTHFRALPCALNPNKLLSAQQAQRGLNQQFIIARKQSDRSNPYAAVYGLLRFARNDDGQRIGFDFGRDLKPLRSTVSIRLRRALSEAS